MRAFFYQVLGYFLTPAGLVLLGALDASIVFMLPLGIDFAVVILAARTPASSGCTPSWRRPAPSQAGSSPSGSAASSANVV